MKAQKGVRDITEGDTDDYSGPKFHAFSDTTVVCFIGQFHVVPPLTTSKSND